MCHKLANLGIKITTKKLPTKKCQILDLAVCICVYNSRELLFEFQKKEIYLIPLFACTCQCAIHVYANVHVHVHIRYMFILMDMLMYSQRCKN
jgi:hypothetical protein